MSAPLRPQVRRSLPQSGALAARFSTRLSRVLAAGWPHCRKRCSTCFGTTLKLRRSRDGRAPSCGLTEGWIFSDEIGRALNPRTDWDNWKKLLKAAGLRDGRLHDARPTAATVLLLLGVHERTIMSVLGWSTTAMVSRHAHVVAPIHSDVASRLDVLLWSSPNSAKTNEI
jgi:integrase